MQLNTHESDLKRIRNPIFYLLKSRCIKSDVTFIPQNKSGYVRVPNILISAMCYESGLLYYEPYIPFTRK